jgi:heme-degrading monooxygenase HmoA
MIKIVEMDERVTLADQMEEKNVGSLILINKFNVNPEETEEFLEVWAVAAEIFKQQPGYISAQLYRGTAGSCVFVAYVVFESPELFKEAFNNPDFQSKISEYSVGTVASPHLFKKVAVPGICVG